MSHTPHELHDVFPEFTGRIHDMKLSDDDFRQLTEEHHRVNREIHRIEAETEPASDLRWEALKKRRLVLVDQIRDRLTAAG